MYRGGPLIGGHDHPSSGEYEIYADGYLVQTAGIQNTIKRTNQSSALYVDGYGEHGDFVQEQEAVPEAGTCSGAAALNNAFISGYLDLSGNIDPDLGGVSHIDVVSFGSNLTQLYRVDSCDDDRGTSYWVTDPEGASRHLDELTRYGVWVGDPTPRAGSGGLFQYDYLESTILPGAAQFDLTWRLVASDRTSADERTDSCSVQ